MQPALRLTRLPGEHGPILRCSGELSVATLEVLRRELFLLMSLGHPVMTLTLSDCTLPDLDGLLAILQTARQLRAEGRDLVLITGGGPVSRRLSGIAIDRLLPVFSTEAEAEASPRARPATPEGTEDPLVGAIETLEATRRSECESAAAIRTSASL
jgi:hypothetical protein